MPLLLDQIPLPNSSSPSVGFQSAVGVPMSCLCPPPAPNLVLSAPLPGAPLETRLCPGQEKTATSHGCNLKSQGWWIGPGSPSFSGQILPPNTQNQPGVFPLRRPGQCRPCRHLVTLHWGRGVRNTGPPRSKFRFLKLSFVPVS